VRLHVNSRDRLAFIADHAAEPCQHGCFELLCLPGLLAGAEVVSPDSVIVINRLRCLDWRPLPWGTVFVSNVLNTVRCVFVHVDAQQRQDEGISWPGMLRPGVQRLQYTSVRSGPMVLSSQACMSSKSSMVTAGVLAFRFSQPSSRYIRIHRSSGTLTVFVLVHTVG
jgi:hypothetical protein